MVSLRDTFSQILQLEDHPKSIAWGVTVGFFVAMTPPIWPQSVIAFGFAWLFRCNRLAAALTTWLTNPLTWLPCYGVSYLVGATWLRLVSDRHGPTWSEVWTQWTRSESIAAFLSSTAHFGWWILCALFIGGFVVSVICAPFVYFGVLKAVTVWRNRGS